MKKQENKITYFVLERNEFGSPTDYIKSVGNEFMRCKFIEGSDIPEISNPTLQDVSDFIDEIENKKEKSLSIKSSRRRGKR